MTEFGLLGRKLSHSHSPELHRMLGGYEYALIEKEPEELCGFFGDRNFKAINVTIPYKKAVIPYCDELSPTAAEIGSVNAIVNDSGRLIGYNTDYSGFMKLIESSGISVDGKKCLVLGNGGVAPTVRAALRDLNAASIVTVTRNGEVNYVNLCNHYDAEIIVNATPVGMYPNNGERLIDLSRFHKCTGVFDLIYNPLRTALLCDADSLGIPAAGGLFMLAAQAAAAVRLFTGASFSEKELQDAYGSLLRRVRNIVLIGMPGCGKTATGSELCKLIGMRHIDCDTEFEKRRNCTIPEYFARYGETAFRKLETEILVDITKAGGSIISTGGGVILRPENYRLLHQNGVIVFLDRSISELPTPVSGRLSLRYGGEALAALQKLVRSDRQRQQRRRMCHTNNGGVKMKILVINGPNLNMLGIREPDIYGIRDYKALCHYIMSTASDLGLSVEIFQSNHEGAIVDKIQASYGAFDGIVINAAAYTHTSVAILDALKAVGIPAVEVHLTDINAREDFRKRSFPALYCFESIVGKGFEGYADALRLFAETNS